MATSLAVRQLSIDSKRGKSTITRLFSHYLFLSIIVLRSLFRPKGNVFHPEP